MPKSGWVNVIFKCRLCGELFTRKICILAGTYRTLQLENAVEQASPVRAPLPAVVGHGPFVPGYWAG